jgi:hypothetical protein
MFDDIAIDSIADDESLSDVSSQLIDAQPGCVVLSEFVARDPLSYLTSDVVIPITDQEVHFVGFPLIANDFDAPVSEFLSVDFLTAFPSQFANDQVPSCKVDTFLPRDSLSYATPAVIDPLIENLWCASGLPITPNLPDESDVKELVPHDSVGDIGPILPLDGRVPTCVDCFMARDILSYTIPEIIFPVLEHVLANTRFPLVQNIPDCTVVSAMIDPEFLDHTDSGFIVFPNPLFLQSYALRDVSSFPTKDVLTPLVCHVLRDVGLPIVSNAANQDLLDAMNLLAIFEQDTECFVVGFSNCLASFVSRDPHAFVTDDIIHCIAEDCFQNARLPVVSNAFEKDVVGELLSDTFLDESPHGVVLEKFGSAPVSTFETCDIRTFVTQDFVAFVREGLPADSLLPVVSNDIDQDALDLLTPVSAKLEPEFTPLFKSDAVLPDLAQLDPRAFVSDEFVHSLFETLFVDSGLPVVPNVIRKLPLGLFPVSLLPLISRDLVVDRWPSRSISVFESRHVRSFARNDIVDPILSGLVNNTGFPLLPNVADHAVIAALIPASIFGFVADFDPFMSLPHFVQRDPRCYITDTFVDSISNVLFDATEWPISTNVADGDIIESLLSESMLAGTFSDRVVEQSPSIRPFATRDIRMLVLPDTVHSISSELFSHVKTSIVPNRADPAIVNSSIPVRALNKSATEFVAQFDPFTILPHFVPSDARTYITDTLVARARSIVLGDERLPISENVIDSDTLQEFLSDNVVEGIPDDQGIGNWSSPSISAFATRDVRVLITPDMIDSLSRQLLFTNLPLVPNLLGPEIVNSLIPIGRVDEFPPESDPRSILPPFIHRDPRSYITNDFVSSICQKIFDDSSLPLTRNQINDAEIRDFLPGDLFQAIDPVKSPLQSINSFETRDPGSFPIRDLLDTIVRVTSFPLVSNALISDDTIRDLMSTTFLDDAPPVLVDEHEPSRPIDHFSGCDVRVLVANIINPPMITRLINPEPLPLLANLEDDAMVATVGETNLITEVRDSFASSMDALPSFGLRDPRSFVNDRVVVQTRENVLSPSVFPLHSNQLTPNDCEAMIDPISSGPLSSVVSNKATGFLAAVTPPHSRAIRPDELSVDFLTDYLDQISLPFTFNFQQPELVTTILTALADTSLDILVSPPDIDIMRRWKSTEPKAFVRKPVTKRLVREFPFPLVRNRQPTPTISEITKPSTFSDLTPVTPLKTAESLANFQKERRPVSDFETLQAVRADPTEGVLSILHADDIQPLMNHTIKGVCCADELLGMDIVSVYSNDVLYPLGENAYVADKVGRLQAFRPIERKIPLRSPGRRDPLRQSGRPLMIRRCPRDIAKIVASVYDPVVLSPFETCDLKTLPNFELADRVAASLHPFVEKFFEQELVERVLSELPVVPIAEPVDAKLAAEDAAGELINFDPNLNHLLATPLGALSTFEPKASVSIGSRRDKNSPLRDVIVDILLQCYEGDEESEPERRNEYEANWLSSAGLRIRPKALRLEEEDDEQDDDEEEEEEEEEAEEEEEEEEEEEDADESSSASETTSAASDEST